ncbi:hypothetical protein PP304_gp139 [Gordonia phage Phendrix]|uniref:Uncharacterized protein n=1 Tax=Gordonia phage Phendrix TaxID=2593335 RepID=A0A514U1B8_9CAUD|nr:hypothetical protein PP304_gp139 [Gordonia phage Phendrix]QDK02730.1 hypothetical protein SEA_PHENDRIX_214 [Gordonia phage Phendrix]
MTSKADLERDPKLVDDMKVRIHKLIHESPDGYITLRELRPKLSRIQRDHMKDNLTTLEVSGAIAIRTLDSATRGPYSVAIYDPFNPNPKIKVPRVKRRDIERLDVYFKYERAEAMQREVVWNTVYRHRELTTVPLSLHQLQERFPTCDVEPILQDLVHWGEVIEHTESRTRDGREYKVRTYGPSPEAEQRRNDDIEEAARAAREATK